MRHCFVLDVFTRHGAGGNPLGVITDTSGLSDEIMQVTATDLGYSETVFIDWRQGGRPELRIFTPGEELPFAGHPTVGAAWVLNVLGPGGVDSLGCPAGEVFIHAEGHRLFIEAPRIERTVQPGKLGALEGWVNPISVDLVISSSEFLLVEVPDARAVAAATQPTTGHAFLWARDGDNIKARFFAPDVKVSEDAATGGAAIALGVLLRSRGIEFGDLLIRQGDEIGAPSEIHLRWDGPRSWVGGSVAHRTTRMLDV
jgi:trans-2,3-dihydro-3-hydroxyanthranilate isomerase